MEIDVVAFSPFLAGAAGLLTGSFLNVCIYRIPRDLSVVAPRSFCPECGCQISWYDNIPLMSFVLLGGKCRKCAKAIGVRYPAVEITTAILFASIAALYGQTLNSLKWMIFDAMMIVLFVTDLEERILPDEVTLGGSIAALILAFFIPVPGLFGQVLLPNAELHLQSLLNAASGACLLSVPMAMVGFLYANLRNRQGLGLGDIKLLILIGAFLGFEKGIAALLVAAVGGAVLGLLFILITRKQASTYELPFGSFLCAAAGLMPLIQR